MDHSSFEIRQANPLDAPQVEALYRQLVPGSPISVLPSRLAALSVNPHAYLVVADRGGAILGTAFMCLCPDAMYGDQPFAVVENVVVDTSARGSGVGSALLQHLEDLALRADCSKIMLSSSVARSDAHAFFERSGFGAAKVGFVKYRRAFGATGAGPNNSFKPKPLRGSA